MKRARVALWRLLSSLCERASFEAQQLADRAHRRQLLACGCTFCSIAAEDPAQAITWGRVQQERIRSALAALYSEPVMHELRSPRGSQVS